MCGIVSTQVLFDGTLTTVNVQSGRSDLSNILRQCKVLPSHIPHPPQAQANKTKQNKTKQNSTEIDLTQQLYNLWLKSFVTKELLSSNYLRYMMDVTSSCRRAI